MTLFNLPQHRKPGFRLALCASVLAFVVVGLGAFTRLALAEGKTGYGRHRERLKALLRRTLSHPVLSDIRLWYEPYI